MTGICGFVGFEDKKLLKNLGTLISYRGDNEIVFTDKTTGLLERNFYKNKKAVLKNEDESIYMVCDAQIYNCRELKRDLENKGHDFATDFNEEVIIHLYEELGSNCCNVIDGDFAFAVWDSNKNRLLLARDKIGISPLYYTLNSRGLYFASEIKPLLYIQPNRQFNLIGVSHYLVLDFCLEPNTFYKNIFSLLPSHILTYGHEKVIRIKKYWEPRLSISKNKDESYYSNRLYQVLKDAINKRLGSSNCAYLSGGIDSSAIVAILSELSYEPVKTFSFNMSDQDNELSSAKIVADYCDTEHTEIQIDPDATPKLYPKLVWQLDYPYYGMFSLYLASQEVQKASKKNANIFTGHAADALLFGHGMLDRWLDLKFIRQTLYMFLKISNFYNRKNINDNRSLNFIQSLSDPTHQILFRYNDAQKFFPRYKDIINDLSAKIVGPFDFNHPKEYNNRIMLLKFNLFALNEFIPYIERIAAVNSLSSKVPYLDTNVFEFFASIPPFLRNRRIFPFGNGNPASLKYILRKSMREKLPKVTLYREKAAPDLMHSLFNSDFREVMKQLLDNPSILNYDFFNQTEILKLIDEFTHHRGKWTLQPVDKKLMDFIYRLSTLELLHKTFIERGDIRHPLSLKDVR